MANFDTVTEKEFQVASAKLKAAWNCTIHDDESTIKQFDVNVEIVHRYRAQQPLSEEDEQAYQESLKQQASYLASDN
jgi:histidinol dehydrogenase